MKSNYEIIRPPFPVTFGSMSKDDVEKHFRWFIEQIPHRIEMLGLHIQSSSGYENWTSDLTPPTLSLLGKWFCEHVETRKRTKKEKEDIYLNSPSWFHKFDIPENELSSSTLSLAIDIGIYFGRTLEKNIPDLSWQPLHKPKNSVDYQRPVIVGKGNVPLNPVRIVVTYAFGISRGSKGPNRLLELYEIWAGLLID